MQAPPHPTSHLDPLDLRHLGTDRVIGAYLLDTPDGPALVDCGPSSCLDQLEAALTARGCALADLRHLLITHVHLDHAGAAGAIVERNPAVMVHVSPIGAPHLLAPQRLERSARRVFGEAYDQLWGSLTPVPEHRLAAVADGDDVVGLRALATPGHAAHHMAWLHGDGTLFTGDAGGVRIMPGSQAWPVAPPPDIDVPTWLSSVEVMRRARPERLGLAHFGIVGEDVDGHLDDLAERIRCWAGWVADGADVATFEERVRAGARQGGVGTDLLARYEQTGPPAMSHAGLARYVERAGDAP